MKKVLIGILIFLSFTGCKREQTPEEEVKQRINKKQEFAREILSKILYIKDHRTGLCFAYMWDGSMNGGPALTVVPEDKIPAYLLIHVKN